MLITDIRLGAVQRPAARRARTPRQSVPSRARGDRVPRPGAAGRRRNGSAPSTCASPSTRRRCSRQSPRRSDRRSPVSSDAQSLLEGARRSGRPPSRLKGAHEHRYRVAFVPGTTHADAAGWKDAPASTATSTMLLRALDDVQEELRRLTADRADLLASAELWADLYAASVDRANAAEALLQRLADVPGGRAALLRAARHDRGVDGRRWKTWCSNARSAAGVLRRGTSWNVHRRRGAPAAPRRSTRCARRSSGAPDLPWRSARGPGQSKVPPAFSDEAISARMPVRIRNLKKQRSCRARHCRIGG